MPRHTIDTSIRLKPSDFEPRTQPDEKAAAPVAPPFSEPELVPREPYVALAPVVEALNMAIALGRPLLLQGDPGCGKTRLAYAVANVLGYPIEEAYVKSTSRAQDLLYTFDAVRQLYDAQLGDLKERKEYVRFGPLGRAIVRATHGQRSVVLLDEIDKADLDYPNDLLWELDQLEFRVEEVPELRYSAKSAQLRPIVLITHNEEKQLPTAFLRRCVFFHLEFPPDPSFLRDLLRAHGLNGNGPIASGAIEIVLRLRQLDLTKSPGLSELLDWVGYLEAVRTPASELHELPHIGLLLKQHADQLRGRQGISRPMTPEARS